MVMTTIRETLVTVGACMNRTSAMAAAANGDPAFTEALCREALDPRLADFFSTVREAPADAKGWFHLLADISADRSQVAVLRRLGAAARQAGFPAGATERFAALQAFLEALPRLASLDVHEQIVEQFRATCRRVASRPEGWGDHFDCGSDPFWELARIVALHRFHAGQVSFDIMAMPRTWLLKIHPFALSGVIQEIVAGMGGIGPIVMPHINYWRNTPFLIREKENDLSFWRIAKTIERQPDLKGVIAASWLYSRPVAEFSPHLKWVRTFYESNGAHLVDMEPAPLRSGFLVGSASRQQLYDEGKFRPRVTLVLWRRADILAWAERYEGSRLRHGTPAPPAAKEEWEAPRAPADPAPARPAPRSRNILASGRYTLVNLERLLNEKPRHYAAMVFLAPGLIASVSAAIAFGWMSVLPAVALTIVFMWLLQYFFLQ